MAETTDQYKNRISQIKTSIENEPEIVKMREDIAEGISKTGNRQADIEVRQGTLEEDFVKVQQDASSVSPSGAEVAVARGEYSTLDGRLTAEQNKVNAQLAKTETNKADIVYVDQSISRLSGGAIKGTYTTLSALKQAYPEGTIGPFLVEEDDNRYIWDINKLDWVSIGPYDPAEIGENEVGALEINPSANSVNRFDKTKAVVGSYYAGTIGNIATIRSSSAWAGILEPIPISPGTVLRFNKAFQNGYYVGVDDNNVVRQLAPTLTTEGYAEIIVDDLVTKFYSTSYTTLLDEFMMTINNPMPKKYVPHILRKQLDWIVLPDRNVTEEKLSNDLRSKINAQTPHKYVGTDGVLTGDSIVWNTGKNPTGSEVLIGYDGVLKRELNLNSIENFGYSGKPLSSGSANGAGIYENLITETINWLSKKFLLSNAGTNDFKLDMDVGELNPFGSDFDTSTYIGAYQALIEFVKNKNPDIEIVIMTPAQRDNGGYTTESTNTAGHRLFDYVDAAKRVAQKYSATLVDVYSESGITELTIIQDTYDGLHLNNSGYEKGGGLAIKKMIYG